MYPPMADAVAKTLLVTHVDRYAYARGMYKTAQGPREMNREWRTMLWLMTSTSGLWEAAQPHINFKRAEVEWAFVPTHLLSRSERLLFDLAQHLFTGCGPVDLAELIRVVDDECWAAVLAALQCARGAVDDPMRAQWA